MKADYDERKALENELQELYNDVINRSANEDKLEATQDVKGRIAALYDPFIYFRF
jgi:hypothetical protein